MKLYVASSWRNKYQPDVVQQLRAAAHEVYDFRHPAPGNQGFAWSEIDPAWQSWTPAQYREALRHPIAQRGFGCDRGGMEGAEGCVLVLPCGRSAHLEAGWFMGRGLPVWVLVPEPCEPELMYLLGSHGADALCLDVAELLTRLAHERPGGVCDRCGQADPHGDYFGGFCAACDLLRPEDEPDPIVCPGCQAIGPERCAPQCPDAAIALKAEEEDCCVQGPSPEEWSEMFDPRSR